MARLRWSVAARRDLIEIGDYIARDSRIYAVGVVERLIAAAETLVASPKRGRMVPEYSDPAVRELILRKYRIVYRVDGDAVTIARIVHGARDLRSEIGDPWVVE